MGTFTSFEMLVNPQKETKGNPNALRWWEILVIVLIALITLAQIWMSTTSTFYLWTLVSWLIIVAAAITIRYGWLSVQDDEITESSCCVGFCFVLSWSILTVYAIIVCLSMI